MRILHVGKFYPPVEGGMEIFLRDLCREQVRRGHRVAVLGLRRSRADGRDGAVVDGVTVWRAPTLAPRSPVPFAPGFARRFRRLLRHTAPDIVHVHLPNASALPLDFGAARAVVVHWHAEAAPAALGFPLALALPAYEALVRRVLAAADLVVATSRSVLAASRLLAPVASRCRVVPLGVDSARLAAPPDAPGGPPLVVSLGRFVRYKGFEHCIRAAALLPEVRFVLAGDGPGLAAARRLAADLGLGKRVSLPGSLPDRERNALLAACDVFCLPSVDRAEAFGLVLLEAMCHAKPLVACSPPGSGVGEVVEDGVTGLIAPVADPDGLARTLGRLLADPEAARRMGRAGRARLEARYRIADVARSLDALYAEVLAGRPCAGPGSVRDPGASPHHPEPEGRP